MVFGAVGSRLAEVEPAASEPVFEDGPPTRRMEQLSGFCQEVTLTRMAISKQRRGDSGDCIIVVLVAIEFITKKVVQTLREGSTADSGRAEGVNRGNDQLLAQSSRAQLSEGSAETVPSDKDPLALLLGLLKHYMGRVSTSPQAKKCAAKASMNTAPAHEISTAKSSVSFYVRQAGRSPKGQHDELFALQDDRLGLTHREGIALQAPVEGSSHAITRRLVSQLGRPSQRVGIDF